MEKKFYSKKKFLVVLALTVVFVLCLVNVSSSVCIKAENNNAITSNEEVYRELTSSDNLEGLEIKIDDYFNNIKNDYYKLLKNST